MNGMRTCIQGHSEFYHSQCQAGVCGREDFPLALGYPQSLGRRTKNQNLLVGVQPHVPGERQHMLQASKSVSTSPRQIFLSFAWTCDCLVCCLVVRASSLLGLEVNKDVCWLQVQMHDWFPVGYSFITLGGTLL